jgi:hypothetical protein
MNFVCSFLYSRFSQISNLCQVSVGNREASKIQFHILLDLLSPRATIALRRV